MSEEEKENVKRILSIEEKWHLLFRQAEGPPMYRPEEYIFHLRKWFVDSSLQTTDNRERDKKCRDGTNDQNNHHQHHHHQHQSVSIVLTELLDISELLRNLKFDLKLAHAGFVAEFAREPSNGILLLLDFLKTTHLGTNEKKEENNNNQGGSLRNGIHMTKKTLADEYECLLSLKHATRYQETMKYIIEHPSGVFIIASCAISNFMKSRIVALELLIKTCEYGTEGHSHVLKAMSSLRLRIGEPIRFKFLIGMLSSPGSKSLTFQTYCLSFLNKLLETSKNVCNRVYLQCEIEEAGLDSRMLQKFTECREFADHKAYVEAFRAWKRNYVDVESLVTVSKRLTSDNKELRGEIEKLKDVTKKLEEDKISLMNIEKELSEQLNELEQKVSTLSKTPENSQSDEIPDSKNSTNTEEDSNEDIGTPKTSSSESESPTSTPPPEQLQLQLKGSDAMSISSEESPKSRSTSKHVKELSRAEMDGEQDIIVPRIQQRHLKCVWSNRNNDSLRLIRNVSNRDDLFQQVGHDLRVMRHSCSASSSANIALINDNSVVVGRRPTHAMTLQHKKKKVPQGHEDMPLNWSYPAVPLPIAVVTSGKSSLQDMDMTASANANDTKFRSPRNSEPSVRSEGHRSVPVDFHKTLFQRSYPVPSADRITRTFHV